MRTSDYQKSLARIRAKLTERPRHSATETDRELAKARLEEAEAACALHKANANLAVRRMVADMEDFWYWEKLMEIFR